MKHENPILLADTSRRRPRERTPGGMKHENLILLAVLTLAALLAGYVLSLFLTFTPDPLPISTPTPLPPPTATPAPTATSAATVSILLLGVDSLTSHHPELESVWVVSFIPGTSTYYYFGFSPDSLAKISRADTPLLLREAFDLDTNMARGNWLTRDALHNLLQGMVLPQADVMYDRNIFRQAIDRLGGITLYGWSQSGQDVLDLWDALPADPQIRLEFEEEILRATLAAIQIRQWTPANVLAYFNLGQVWIPSYDAIVQLSQMAPPSLNFTFTVQYAPLKGEGVP